MAKQKAQNRKFTYGLYQNNFEVLTEVLALLEIGKKSLAYKRLISTLQKDRGEFFDPKEFWEKVKWKKEVYESMASNSEEEIE